MKGTNWISALSVVFAWGLGACLTPPSVEPPGSDPLPPDDDTASQDDDTDFVDADGDGSPQGVDCRDDDPTIHPDAAEVVDDGIDQDCNGTDTVSYYRDQDEDGHGTGGQTFDADGQCDAGWVGTAGDCSDHDPDVHPGAEEVVDDGIDQDCDGSDATNCFRDADLDGFGSGDAEVVGGGLCDEGWAAVDGDCDDGSATAFPGAEEACDGLDQDCDGSAAGEEDADSDGYRPCGPEPDCDDAVPAVHPGALESCDTLDNDCNGVADDGLATTTWYADADGDGFGDAHAAVTTCSGPPDGYGSDATDCDDADSNTSPEGVEVEDGADNDCNGVVDDVPDTVTWTTTDDFLRGGVDGMAHVTDAGGGAVELAPSSMAVLAPDPQQPLPADAWGMGLVASRAHLYCLGGWYDEEGDLSGTNSAAVRVAEVREDGSLGPWDDTQPALPSAYAAGAVATDGSHLVVMGGAVGADGWSDAVFTAPLLEGGDIGGWSSQVSLPAQLRSAGAAALRGFVYFVGGFDELGVATDAVYVARLDPDGTLDGWTPTTPLPATRVYPGVVAAGDSLYVAGGHASPDDAANTVFRGVPDSSGHVSAWTNVSSLPEGRSATSVVAADGHLFLLGGVDIVDNAWIHQMDVLAARVLSTGALSGWTTMALAAPDQTYSQGLAAWGDTLYQVGGFGSDATYTYGGSDDVYAVPIDVSAATTHAPQGSFEATFDLGADRGLTSLDWGGDLGAGGSLEVWVRIALDGIADAGVWTPLGTSPPVPLEGTGRYVDVWVHLSDPAGTGASLTDVTLEYR